MEKFREIDCNSYVLKCKSTIDSKYKISTNMIASGSNGIVFDVISDNKEKYVAKISTRGKIEPVDINEKVDFNLARYEATITQLMSDIKVCPKVYDISVQDDTVIIISERYDRILTDKEFDSGKYTTQINSLISKMHAVGVCHRDICNYNVVIKNEVVKLIDFGNSIFSNDKQLQQEDIIESPNKNQCYKLHQPIRLRINKILCKDWA